MEVHKPHNGVARDSRERIRRCEALEGGAAAARFHHEPFSQAKEGLGSATPHSSIQGGSGEERTRLRNNERQT